MNTDNLKKEIKKVKVWHVAVLCTGIFLAFAIIGSILLAASGFGGMFRNGIHFGDFGNIGPGETFDVDDYKEIDLEGVDKIVITTVSDDVLLTGGGDKVTANLKGQCRSAGKPVWLETRVQGDTAYIEVKYPMSINFSTTNLAVSIPDAYAGSLAVRTVSGKVEAEGLPHQLGQAAVNTTSGDIRFGTASYERLKVGTVSGAVHLTGIAAETDVGTTSGEINLVYASLAETTASSVSGDVRAQIPEDASFAVDFDSVSGDFRSNHPAMSADADGGYRGAANGGEKTIKVRTTSGSFEIEAK